MDIYYGFDQSWGLMNALFPIFFLAVLAILVFKAVNGIGQWSRNHNAPVLTVDAKIVAKRTDTATVHHGNPGDTNHMHHHTTSTSYFITFQVESGDRMEFDVKDRDYGMLAEGDMGKLTFQGTRYMEFQRQ